MCVCVSPFAFTNDILCMEFSGWDRWTSTTSDCDNTNQLNPDSRCVSGWWSGKLSQVGMYFSKLYSMLPFSLESKVIRLSARSGIRSNKACTHSSNMESGYLVILKAINWKCQSLSNISAILMRSYHLMFPGSFSIGLLVM